MREAWADFRAGLWSENPVFRGMVGLCPALAVTTAASLALSLGAATLAVLAGSALAISLVRRWIPEQARIPCQVGIVGAFVTLVDMVLGLVAPETAEALGIFVPLIVVNSLVLGRMEGFARRNPPGRALLDAVGMGLGFTGALLVIGSVREILGAGTWFGQKLLGDGFIPLGILVTPSGAFLTLGVLVAFQNWAARSFSHRAGAERLLTARVQPRAQAPAAAGAPPRL